MEAEEGNVEVDELNLGILINSCTFYCFSYTYWEFVDFKKKG